MSVTLLASTVFLYILYIVLTTPPLKYNDISRAHTSAHRPRSSLLRGAILESNQNPRWTPKITVSPGIFWVLITIICSPIQNSTDLTKSSTKVKRNESRIHVCPPKSIAYIYRYVRSSIAFLYTVLLRNHLPPKVQ